MKLKTHQIKTTHGNTHAFLSLFLKYISEKYPNQLTNHITCNVGSSFYFEFFQKKTKTKNPVIQKKFKKWKLE
jgi:hypothetical protein